MVYFLQDWIVNPMLNPLKRTMTYLGFEPGTFGVAVSIPNHYTIEVIIARELKVKKLIFFQKSI
jgi:hypothetical protein